MRCILKGLLKACEKRPVSIDTIEDITNQVERFVQKNYEREVNTQDVGEIVMEKLAQLDEVAYVRFASVYRSFEDVNAFREEVERLQQTGATRSCASGGER